MGSKYKKSYRILKSNWYIWSQSNYKVLNLKEKLGNGKFGLVKLGKHKETGKLVAIKIMKKQEMKDDDIEMARTEIEIMKISQHPNIIRLYDVFENVEFIYISNFYSLILS